MSPLAQLLAALGCRCSGSDRLLDQKRPLPVFTQLQAKGIRLHPQDGSAVTAGLDAVIASSAIEADNPDLVAAQSLEVPIIHRAEALASLAKDKTCIAVTGTAGKSTVTGMIGWTLAAIGLDPTVVNGAPLLNWANECEPGNFRLGRSKWWVLELDESDRSFLRFHPAWAVITNISKDHFELSEVRSLFAQFAGQVKNGIIGCDPRGNGMILPADFEPLADEKGVSFRHAGTDFVLPLLGYHNAINALQCVMLCEKLGIASADVARGLEKFKGIARRLERVGEAGGVRVIDDYAHNPAKISAAWKAVQPFSRSIVAIWRPHGYGPLALMRSEISDAFAALAGPRDKVLLLPVYFAGGTARRDVTSEMLVADLVRRGVNAICADNYDVLSKWLAGNAHAGDTILLMGARDPDLPVFARRLVLELRDLIANRPSGARGVAQEN